MEKNSFVLYMSYRSSIDMMSMEERGELLTAIYDFVEDKYNPNDVSTAVKFVMAFIGDNLKKDADKWEDKKQARIDKAKSAANARWNSTNNASACSSISEHTNNASDAVNVNVNVNGNVNDKDNKTYCPSCDGREVQNQDQSSENLTVETADGAGKDKPVDHSTTLIEQRFDAFWAAYPLKVGKKKARAAWKKLAPTQTLHADIMRALSAQKNSYDWTKDGGQFIPHPTTWLNRGGWEDELRTDAPEHTRPNKYISPEYRDFSGMEE